MYADGTAPPSLLLLGPPAVRCGRRVEPVSGRRQTLLFCVLAADPGSVVETARLIHALWEKQRPADPDNALQSLVSRLRRPPYGVPVVRAAAGYRIDVEPDDVDAARFERLVVDARALVDAGAPAAARDQTVTALRLWRGTPLGEVSDARAVRTTVARLEELRLDAHVIRAEADLALGLHRRVVPPLRRLVAAHPLREDVWELLVLALYRAGRPSEALGAYRRARGALVAELGIEPGPRLRALERAVLDRSPSLEPPAHPCAAHALELAGPDSGPRPLDCPPPVGPEGPVANWHRYPAARRFLGRVRASVPSYRPDRREAAQIVTLCRLLDGDPLAIELAAGALPHSSLGALLARHREALLARSVRPAPATRGWPRAVAPRTGTARP